MKEDITYLQVNNKTGEVTVPEGRFFTQKQLDANREYKEIKAKIEEKLCRNKLQNIECGKFVWLLFNYCQELFPEIGNADITRLLFISTYLGYDDGVLKLGNGIKIDKSKMQKLLNIGDTAFKQFWKSMMDNNIFIVETNKIMINDSYFKRGRIYTDEKIDANIIRLFVDGVRQLYAKANPASHKQLAYLFRIIPYINTKYNIVCSNPEETDIDKVEPLTMAELCELLGYDKNNARKLKAYFKSCTFGEANLRAVRYVVDDSDIETWQMFINPKVYYAGDDYKQVEVLGGFKQ